MIWLVALSRENGQIKVLFKSVREVINKKNYFILFLMVTLGFITLFISISVFATPGNSVALQLKIFTPLNYLTIFIFSSLVGLMFSMQVYNYKIKKSLKKVGEGIFGGLSGFAAGIFGTASCASCIAVIFGFLGTGTVFFLVEKQVYVMSVSLIFLLLSIYLTSLSINKNCEGYK